jgi:hypothetical protein
MKLELAENAYLFEPPIEYEVDYYVCKNPDNPDLSYHAADVELENGMVITYDLDNPWPMIKSNNKEEIVRVCLEFDFAHAFGHICEDPNYSYKHWAICGWFKDRYQGEINEDINYE